MKTNTQTALHDLIRYFPSAVIPPFLGIVSISVFTRIFTPEQYGCYILVNTIVLFLQMLFFSWLNQSSLRYYEKFKGSLNSFFSTLYICFFILIIAISVFWYSGIVVFKEYFRQSSLYSVLLWIPPLLVAQSGNRFVLSLVRARREGIRYSVHMSMSSVIRLLIPVILFVLYDMGCIDIFIGVIIAGSYILIFETCRFYKKFHVKIGHSDFNMVRKFIYYGAPLIGLSITNNILSSSDRFMIGFFLDASAVGVYSAGYQLAETGINILSYFLMMVFFPVIIKVYETKGQNSAKQLIHDLLIYYLILVTPALAGISVLSSEIVKVLLGNSFSPAAGIMPAVSAGVFFLGLSMYYNKSFELKEQTCYILVIAVLASLVNIILNIIFIPLIGLQGASLSTLVAYMSSFIFSVCLGRRMFRLIFPWRIAFRVALYCFIMCLVVAGLPEYRVSSVSLLYKIFAGAVIYILFVARFEHKYIPLKMKFCQVE